MKAYGGAEYRIVQEITEKLADAIKNTKVDIVPKTIVTMGNSSNEDGSSTSTILDALLKLITIDKLGISLPKEVITEHMAMKEEVL